MSRNKAEARILVAVVVFLQVFVYAGGLSLRAVLFIDPAWNWGLVSHSVSLRDHNSLFSS